MTNALILGTDAPLSIDLLIQQWLHAAYQRTHSDATVRQYRAHLDSFRRMLLGMAGVDMDAPQEAKIAVVAQAWAAGESNARSGATYNAYLAAVSSFYRHAVLMGARRTDGEHMSNPLRMVRRAHVESNGKGAKPLDPADVARAWATIDRSTPRGLRNYAMLALYFSTGRRAMEIATMRMSDVHMDVNGFTLTYQRLKGGKSRVDVLEQAARPLLLAWMAYRYNQWPTTPASALWPSLARSCHDHDAPMGYHSVRNIMLEVFGTGKLHTTRKTFARQSMREGASVVEIMHLLGHSDLSVTTRYLDGMETTANTVGSKVTSALGIGT